MKVSGSLILLLIVSFLPVRPLQGGDGLVDQDKYYCGEACVYGLLHLLGRDVDLATVRSRVDAIAPGVAHGRLNLRQIRETVESFGCPAATIRFQPSDYANVPAHSILFLRPDKVGNADVGHVVLLENVTPDGVAHVKDFMAGAGKKDFTLEQLRSFWDGEAIVLSEMTPKASHLGRIAMVLGTSLILVAIILILRQRYRKYRKAEVA